MEHRDAPSGEAESRTAIRLDLLIALLQATQSQYGDVDVFIEVQTYDGNGDTGSSFHLSDVNGIRFTERNRSVTLIGESDER